MQPEVNSNEKEGHSNYNNMKDSRKQNKNMHLIKGKGFQTNSLKFSPTKPTKAWIVPMLPHGNPRPISAKQGSIKTFWNYKTQQQNHASTCDQESQQGQIWSR